MRRGISPVSIALVALMAAAVLQTSAATTYFVGNTTGWEVPPNTSFYSTWASQYTFVVTDTLVFNYVPGQHDVAEVTKTNYDSCNKTSPIILYPSATGVTNVTLNKTGDYYFICTHDGHCTSGQKLAIKVSANGSTASTPASQPPPPPPPSAAPTKIAAAFTAFMSIAVGLLC
ncbi:hypothetical protein NMG60_11013250 [Bertholletia excelsa]